MRKEYEADGMKVEELETEYVGIAGLIPIHRFKVTLPGGEIREDRLDSREDRDSRMIHYISGARNMAEEYHSLIA